MTRVVNIRQEPCDIRIDRSTPFGNPFILGVDGNREEVCEKHEQWLKQWIESRKEIIINGFSNKWVVEHLSQLKDKILGCWCKSLRCHGDTLIKLIGLLNI